MTKSEYAALMKDERWQEKKFKILQRDGNKCTECGTMAGYKHVHHRYYVSGRMPWDYPDWALTTLCEEHHKRAHENPEWDQFYTFSFESVMIDFLGGQDASHNRCLALSEIAGGFMRANEAGLSDEFMEAFRGIVKNFFGEPDWEGSK